MKNNQIQNKINPRRLLSQINTLPKSLNHQRKIVKLFVENTILFKHVLVVNCPILSLKNKLFSPG